MLPIHENCYYHIAYHTTLGKSPAGCNFQPAFVIYYSMIDHMIKKIKKQKLPDVVIWL